MNRAMLTGLLAIYSALTIAGCEHEGNLDARTEPFDAVKPGETINLTGTEPFWGGEVSDSKLFYRTAENPDGETIAVKRFAGNNGLAFSGTLEDNPLDILITATECSDGMSDRRYPFSVTLALGEDRRIGCAWTAKKPYSGPAQP